jgi:hypothetical protein
MNIVIILIVIIIPIIGLKTNGKSQLFYHNNSFFFLE